MRILGIDPGTRVVGYGIVEEARGDLRPVAFGAIRTGRDLPPAQRYLQIFEGLTEVIRRHRPDEVAVEKVFSGKSPQSAIRIGEGRGLALLAAAIEELPVSEYAATVVKKAVVGSGSGSKEQIQELVRRLLGLREAPRPFDASDALAIAICHCHRRR
jgi:crossover junction endodeoxyribonuclease RuvC